MINKINKDIYEFYKDQEVDFIKLITYKEDNKLSITANYDSLNYSFIDANGSKVSFNDFYYGLSPLFDNKLIKEVIINRTITTSESLTQFINKHHSLFMMYERDIKYIKPIYKKVLLEAMSKFGIKVTIKNDNVYKKIVNIINDDKLTNLKLISEDMLYLLGNITYDLVASFNNKGLYFNLYNNEIIVSDKVTNEFLFNDKDVLNQNFIILTKGVYYSGVMLKLMQIRETINIYSNNLVKSIILDVHRTTFFTEDAFDSKEQNNNSLLNKEDINLIHDFFKLEDNNQLLLMNEDHITIKRVNYYLSESMFTNIVGVTSNLTTLDNMLILAHRNYSVADKDIVYPSVNGHAEFKDNNVMFYKESVFEDGPTIEAKIGDRIDFNGEITRESVAELNISNFETEWNYLGLSMLGVRPNIDKERRRFHFNVLLNNKVSYKSTEVIDLSLKASEKFENKKLYMLDLKVFESKSQILTSYSSNAVKWLAKHKSSILLFFTAFTLITSMYASFKNKEAFPYKKAIDGVFIFVSIVSLIITIVAYYKERQKYKENRRKINYVLVKDTSLNIKEIITKTNEKLDNTYMSPICLLMYRLYIEEYMINK